MIAPGIVPALPVPTFDQTMKTAFWADDNCLYAPAQIFPTFVPFYVLLGGHNTNDQRMYGVIVREAKQSR